MPVYPLPVDDLLYVGPATGRKLHGIGVHTIGQLAELETDCLVHKFGKMGIVLKNFALGQDRTPVTKTDHIPTIKSVGNSATTPRDMTCDEDVHLMLLLLAESVTSRMRELCSKCTTVEVSVRDTGLSWFTRQRKLPMPSCSSDELAEVAFQLFKANYRWQSPVRSIGIRGSGLVEASPFAQCSVFPEDQRRERWEQLDKTVDRLRSRYGYHSIRRAVIKALEQIVFNQDIRRVAIVGNCSAMIACANAGKRNDARVLRRFICSNGDNTTNTCDLIVSYFNAIRSSLTLICAKRCLRMI